MPQLLPPAPLPQREHADHHDASTASGSHTRAHCRYVHSAHAAHSIDTPLLSQAAEHDREASPLRARAAASASLPLAETATALPLHSLHEGAATTSVECLSCCHQRRCHSASMLSTMIHPLHPCRAPEQTVALCTLPMQPTASTHHCCRRLLSAIERRRNCEHELLRVRAVDQQRQLPHYHCICCTRVQPPRV